MKDKIFLFGDNILYSHVNEVAKKYFVCFTSYYSLIEVDLCNKIVKDPGNFNEDFKNHYNKYVNNIYDLQSIRHQYTLNNTPIEERKLFHIINDKEIIKDYLEQIDINLKYPRKTKKEINIEFIYG